jgi:16S rRNA (cytosine1402-N4)-methyltransferase
MTMAATMLPESPSFEHVSVLLGETMDALAPEQGGLYVDVTAGGAGHSSALLSRSEAARLVAFDRDPIAVEAAKRRLAPFGERARVVHGSFADVEAWLDGAGYGAVDGLLADLGVSSPQLEDAGRGMSFRFEGPLDMRMDTTSGETALEIIERLSQDELADAIYQLGEEHRSRRVARCIKQALDAGELNTTLDLRRAVVRAVGPRRIGGVDPSTKTFQALRILVNGELTQLQELLALSRRVVRPGGVVAIISFHSLEDRLVKRAFQDRSVWERLTKKPVVPGDEELARNPRSRSAKLRAARRVDEPLSSERFGREPAEGDPSDEAE